MTIPHILHQTARTSRTTWEERWLTARNRRILGDWDYRLWIDADLPALIGRTFPQFSSAYAEIDRGIVRSDIARYCFLFEVGGVYIDTDYKIVRPLDDLLEHGCVLPLEQGEVGDPDWKLGNAFLASIPRHPFWADLVAQLFRDGGAALNAGNPVLQTGPRALTRCWLANRDKYADIATPSTSALLPGFRMFNFGYERSADTLGVHLCWGSWRGKRGIQAARSLIRRKITCLTP